MYTITIVQGLMVSDPVESALAGHELFVSRCDCRCSSAGGQTTETPRANALENRRTSMTNILGTRHLDMTAESCESRAYFIRSLLPKSVIADFLRPRRFGCLMHKKERRVDRLPGQFIIIHLHRCISKDSISRCMPASRKSLAPSSRRARIDTSPASFLRRNKKYF